jgi:hypothetical protein
MRPLSVEIDHALQQGSPAAEQRFLLAAHGAGSF